MEPVEKHKVGRRDVHVTALGLGTAPIGNLYHALTDERARSVVEAALDAGFGYFDTAPHYGLGLAEERLGAVLAGRPRDSFTLSTKVGRRLRPLRDGEAVDGDGFVDVPPRAREWDFSRDGIRATLESSLERLGLDHVDIVYLHDPDEHERDVYEHGYAALAELRDQGVVGAIGAGMNQSAMPARLVRDFDIDVVLCAGRYTLLDTTALTDLLPECERRGTSVVIGGVYNSGLLADPKPGAPFNYVPAPEAIVARARAIGEVCAEYGVPLRAAALRFPFGHASVASVVVGCDTVDQITDNAAMFRYPIPYGLWPDLVGRGLIPEDVPLPSTAPAGATEGDAR